MATNAQPLTETPLERDERTVDWINDAADPGQLVNAAGETVSVLIRKKVLLAELQGLVKQSVATHFEIGRRLAELQSLADRGEFLKLLQGPLWGFSPASAYQNISFFNKCQEFPKLRDLAESNFTKAIALFNTLENDQLEAFSRGKLPQLTAEEFDAMSVSELKRELKKLKKDVGHIVKEETNALVKERDALIQERDDALAKLEKPDWKAAKDALAKLAELSETLSRKVSDAIALMPDGKIPTDLMIGLETALFRAQTATEKTFREFQIRAEMEG